MAKPEGGRPTGAGGKAYFGFTDQDLEVLDKYVRNNTIERFGPVRSIRAEHDHGFVVEEAFEGPEPVRSALNPASPCSLSRIARLRTDKLPRDADRLDTLLHMLPA